MGRMVILVSSPSSRAASVELPGVDPANNFRLIHVSGMRSTALRAATARRHGQRHPAAGRRDRRRCFPLVALVCTMAIAPVVIAFGWLWYRPLIGIGMLLVGIAATWALAKLMHARAAAKKATASPHAP